MEPKHPMASSSHTAVPDTVGGRAPGHLRILFNDDIPLEAAADKDNTSSLHFWVADKGLLKELTEVAAVELTGSRGGKSMLFDLATRPSGRPFNLGAGEGSCRTLGLCRKVM